MLLRGRVGLIVKCGGRDMAGMGMTRGDWGNWQLGTSGILNWIRIVIGKFGNGLKTAVGGLKFVDIVEG